MAQRHIETSPLQVALSASLTQQLVSRLATNKTEHGMSSTSSTRASLIYVQPHNVIMRAT